MAENQTQQGAGTAGDGAQAQTQQNPNGQQSAPAVDYDKIQQMLDGALAAREDTALKAYFKQQGLSQQEAEQAIATFKQQKAKNTPDVSAMQAQMTQMQAVAQEAQVQSAATMVAVTLGISAKSIPYVLKMADLSNVVGQDGKINEETLKSALNKVLEDVPALKPQASGTTGFVQVGASSNGGSGQQTNQVDQLSSIFGNKKQEKG
jgi:DNA polymerase I-like protein with 3'-5' exonuclease and polymerase domains